MNKGKANLAALVLGLYRKEPGSPGDFISVRLLALQHCVWQPWMSSSELAISQTQTHCWGRVGNNFLNSAVNCSTPGFLQSKEPYRYLTVCTFSRQCHEWMVLSTYGCAAEFQPNFSQQNTLILSSRLLL